MKIILLIVILSVLFIPLIPTKAAFVPCGRFENDPDTNWDDTKPCTFCHLFLMIKKFFDFLINYAALIAALFIAGGGIMLILSGGNEERAATGKKIMTSAVYGLLIVFAAWLIINMVMTMAGYAKFDIEGNPFSGKNWFQIIGCP